MQHERALLEPLPPEEAYEPAHEYRAKHEAGTPVVLIRPIEYEPVVPLYRGKHRLPDEDDKAPIYIGKHRADVPPEYRGKYVGPDGVIISPVPPGPVETTPSAAVSIPSPLTSTSHVPVWPPGELPRRERTPPPGYELSKDEGSEGRALVYDLAVALNEYTKLAAARERSVFSVRASHRKVETARQHYEELRLKAKEWLNEHLNEQGTLFQDWMNISVADDQAEARAVGQGIRFEAERQSEVGGPLATQRQKFYDWWARQGGGEKFLSKHRLVGTAKKSAVLAAVGLPIGIVAGAAGAYLAGPVIGAVAAGGVARGVARGFLRGRIEKSAAPSVASAQYYARLAAQNHAIDQGYVAVSSEHIEYPESVTDVYAAATEKGVERNQVRMIGGVAIGAVTGLIGAYLGDLIHGAIWGSEHEPHVAPPSTEHPTSPSPTQPAPSAPTTPSPSVPPEHGVTGQSFSVEPGSGEIREIQEYAASHNYNITPDDAFRIYEQLYQEHGANIIQLDGPGPSTYVISPGDIGLSHPGTGQWYPGIEDELRALLDQDSTATTSA